MKRLSRLFVVVLVLICAIVLPGSNTFADAGSFPPPATSTPSPADASSSVSIIADLRWYGGDPNDPGTTTYNVYFDTSNPPTTQVITGGSALFYNPGILAENTTYYWRVDAANTYGTTTGTVWSFTTGSSYLISGITKHTIADTLVSPNSVVVGDADNDGDMDIFMDSYAGAEVSVWLNNGNQAFTKSVIGVSMPGAQDIVLADFRRDGDLDVAYVASIANEIGLLENDGSATFTNKFMDNTLLGAYRVGAADLNNDSYLDLVGNGTSENGIAWWSSNDTLGFAMQSVYYTLTQPSAMDVGDIDLDGDVDVVGHDEGSGTLCLFLSNGLNPPGFTPDTVANGYYDCQDILIVDLDSDGDMDLLASYYQASFLIWWENDGALNFTYHLISSANFPQCVDAADFDYDGDMDIVLAYDGATYSIDWLENNGSQVFTSHAVDSTMTQAEDVKFADIDQDGDLDIVATDYSGGALAWYETASLVAPYQPIALNPFDGAVSVPLTEWLQWTGGDPNGDVVTYDLYFGMTNPPSLSQSGLTKPYYNPGILSTGSTYYWFVISSDGVHSDTSATFTFSTASQHVLHGFTKHNISTNVAHVDEVSPADYNGDGYIDFVAAVNVSGQLQYYSNDQDGTFTVSLVTSNYSATSVETVDLDKDGDLDFVATDGSNGRAHWFENSGSESFTEHLITATVATAQEARVADFDGDGDLDVAVAAHADNSVEVYLNDGSQSFISGPILSITNPPTVDAGDFDGDGDIDILAGGYNNLGTDEIAWFENDGSASFSKHTVVSNVDGVRDVQVIDVDLDGDLDFLYLYQVGSLAGWYENNGSGSFTDHIVSTLTNPQYLKGTDVDGDGDVDVLISTDPSGIIAWYENDGAQNFTQRTVTTSGMYTGKISFGDVDVDGYIDAFISNVTLDQIDWWEAVSNQAPNTPTLTYPTGVTGVPVDTTLQWTATDPESDALTYNIYFGTTTNPPLVRTGNTTNSYYPGVMVGGTTYYWKVVAVDPYGAFSEQSAEGSFTTESFPLRTASSILSPTYFQQTGRAITRTRDGGYIMGGDVNDYYLARFDMNGDTLWTKKWGGTANDIISSIISIPGDSFVVAGHRYDGASWVIDVIKMDGNGNIEWTKTFDDGATDFSGAVAATEDGGYIVAGYSDLTDPDQWYDGLAWKLDGAGNTQWMNTFCGAGAEFKFEDVVEAPEGGYVFAGTAYPGPVGGYAAVMMKVSTDGDSLWTQKYGTLGYDFGSSVTTAPDGGYVLVGYSGTGASTTNGMIIKTNSSGVQSSMKTYGGANQETFRSVALATNGDYLIAGSTESFATGGSTDCWLIRADANGDTLWTTTYGQAGTDGAYAVTEGCDRGIVAAGTIDPDANYSYDFYTIKADSIGIVHTAPTTPVAVQPTDAATGVYPLTIFSWAITDAENDSMSFAVYLDSNNPPTTAIYTNYKDTTFSYNLDYNGTYYWQIVATDTYGDVTTGPVWSFQTETNNAPDVPKLTAPGPLATSTSLTQDLYWTAGDADGDSLFFYVYLGTSNPPTTAVDTVSTRFYNTGALSPNTTYYWKVEANDGKSSPVSSAEYSFTTEDSYDIRNFAKHIIFNSIDGIYAVKAGDIDGDGDMDIASSSITYNSLDWWQNDGSGNFVKWPIVTSFLTPKDLKLVDLDQDGDLDVVAVASSTSQNYVYWFENNGSGTFTPREIAIHLYSPACLDVGDIDRDGDLDVVVGTQSAGYDSVAWYENSGSETFTRHEIVAGSSSGLNNIYIADMDGDNDMDILFNSAFGIVSYWANDGNQSFSPIEIVGLGPMYAHTLDVNNDGDMDFISAENNILYYENDGTGTFTFFSSAGSTSAPFLVYGDMEGDGDVDLIVGNSPSNNIKWLRNDGGNYFYSTEVTTAFGGAAGVDLADIDGDGDLDVIGAAPNISELAWFETRPSLPPETPVAISPANGDGSASFASDLVWSCTDLNEQSLTYDVYFGLSSSPPLIASGVADTVFNPGTLVTGTQYYWQIVAMDPDSQFTASSVWSFTVESVTSTQWKRTAGSSELNYWEYARSVACLDDGGFAVFGWNTSYQGWLLTYDVDGNENLNKTYGGTPYQYDFSMAHLSDNGYLLAMSKKQGTGNSDFWLYRTDASGNTTWNYTYGETSTDEQSHGVAQTADGGFIVCGSIAPSGTSWQENGYLVRLNSSGDTLWTATFDRGHQDILYAVKQLGDGSFIATGSSQTGSLDQDIWLLKVDANGSQLFSTTNGGTGDDYGYDLDVLDDGTIVVAGTGESSVIGSYGSADGWLVYFSSAGGYLQRKIFGTTAQDYFRAMDLTNDGGIILAGDVRDAATGLRNTWAVRVNSSGTSLWSITRSIREVDFLYDVQQSPDGGFVFAGQTGNSFSGEQPDYLTMKTLSDGTLNEPPYAASSMDPATGSADLSPRITLTWVGGDPDGDPVFYDVLLGTSDPPTTTVASSIGGTSFTPSGLEYGTTYYWQIVSTDEPMNTTSSSVCSFSTKVDTPPATPWIADGAPPDTAIHVSGATDLAWHSYDVDDDVVTFDVYFGSSNPPPLVQSAQNAKSYNPGVLEPSTKYYWKVVADDGYGSTASSPVWSFTTSQKVFYTIVNYPLFTFSSSYSAPYQMDAADIDGDGDLDLLGLGTSLYTDYLRNNGDDTFAALALNNNKYQASCMKALDFDFDGDVDVLAGVFADSSFAVYENDGSENFTYHEVEGSTYGVIGVDAADMDNDGDLDVVGIGRNSSTVAWFENNGGWSFTKHILDASFTWVEKVFAVDLNNDGYMDVVASMNLAGADQVNAYMNNGDGTFTTQALTSPSVGIEDIAFADIDNDGDLDFIAAEQTSTSVSWYENQGVTAFVRHYAFIAADPTAVDAADMDGDGDYDIVAAGVQTSTMVSWWGNDGSGNFSNQQTIGTGFADATDLHAVDLTGDGVLDVVASSGTSTTPPMAWWKRQENNPPTEPVVISPADGDPNVNENTDLIWSASDPDGVPLIYTLYFDTNTPPVTPVSVHADSNTFDPGTMMLGTTFNWYVVAYDMWSDSTVSPVWSFTVTNNVAPAEPTVVQPTDLAIDVEINPTLEWSCTDQNVGDILSFDVYFGSATGTLSQVSSAQSGTTYSPSTLDYDSTYIWKVVATDTSGYTTEGPVWTFSTAVNQPPSTPNSPSPNDFASDLAVDTKLSWTASMDNEGETVLYDVYFDTVYPPLAMVVSGGDTTTFDPGALSYAQTYYWYVVAKDSYGNSTTGSTWTFDTIQNFAPSDPSSPNPVDAATDVSINSQISWLACTDTEGETVSYKVFFDTVSPPVTQVADGDSTHFNPGTLAYDTQYFWKVIASDTYGNSTEGSQWTFTTVKNEAPTVPSVPSPDDLATNVPINSLLSWEASTDIENDTITYTLYFDTTGTFPSGVIMDADSTHFNPGLLLYNQWYTWRVFAHDSYGNVTEGPYWAFTTVTNDPPPLPSWFLPANDSTGVPILATLSWEAVEDVNGDAVNYDLYFDTVNPPTTKVVDNGDTSYWYPPQLDYNTTYYWQVDAKDSYGNLNPGTVNSFSTLNLLPSVPANPWPLAGETGGVGIWTPVRWTCDDKDGDPLLFDVYFGVNNPPDLVSVDQDTFSYATGAVMPNTTYYWQVKAKDSHDGETLGPLWSFHSANHVENPCFTMHTIYESIYPITGVATADMNHDGNQDIVAVSVPSGEIPSTLAWWQNTGTGWNYAAISAVSGSVYDSAHVTIADIDADNYPDIVTNRENEMQVWLNTGNGLGWDDRHIPSSAGNSAAAIDLDNDGTLELIDSDSRFWDSDGSTWTEYTYSSEANQVVHWGDLDGDGDFDLVGTDPTSGKVVWWENDGDAGGWTEHEIGLDFYDVTAIRVADMNLDFRLDVIAVSSTTGEIVWWENGSEAASWTKHSVGSGFDAPTDLIASDFDFDRDVDLLVANDANGVILLENEGDSWTLNDVEDAVDSTGFAHSYQLAIADLDNDGDLDILAPNRDNGTLVWFETKDNNYPGTPTVHQPTDQSTDIAVDITLMWGSSDVNGDTLKYDLFFDTANPPTNRLQSNDTSSTFQATDLLYSTTYYWKVVVNDGHGGVVEGDVWSFTTVANQPPAEPAQPDPADLATDVAVDVELSWAASVDPEGQDVLYRVYFGTGEPSTLPRVSEQSETVYSPSGLTTNTSYTWRIVSVDALGDSTVGSNWSFTTLNTPPSEFALLTPVPDDTNHTGSVEVTWERSFDPDAGSSIEYTIDWSLDEHFATISSATVTDTFFTITGLEESLTSSSKLGKQASGAEVMAAESILAPRSRTRQLEETGSSTPQRMDHGSNLGTATVPLPDDSYLYIRVFAKDDHDAVTWSDLGTNGINIWIEYFDAPLAFTLSNPVADAVCYTLDTTLTWQATTDPDPGDEITYSVLLSNLPDLSGVQEVASGLDQTSLLLENLEPFSEYYWTVHAQDLNTAGTWASDTLHFSTHHWKTTMTVNLKGRKFEWLSFCFLGANKTVSSLFSEVTSQFIMLRDGAGNVTIPNKGIDGIGQIDPDAGYQVFLNADASLTMNGTALHPATQYTLRSNRWNLLVNPLIDTTNVETALQELSGHLIAVQNDMGEIWAPDQSVMTLTRLIPGEAYQILVDETMSFVYGRGSSASTTTTTVVSRDKGPRIVRVEVAASSPPPTGLPYNVFVTLDRKIREKEGQILELIEDDKVVGASVLPEEGDVALVTAWKGIPEFQVGGFTSGKAVRARVKDADGNLIPVRVKGAGLRYGEGGYGTIEIELVPLPERFEVSKPYPNPFNPTATIVVALPEQARVHVEVYNVLGQRVDVLQDGVLPAGYNRVLMNGSRWSSGVYFVRVAVPGQRDELRKMVLIR